MHSIWHKTLRYRH